MGEAGLEEPWKTAEMSLGPSTSKVRSHRSRVTSSHTLSGPSSLLGKDNSRLTVRGSHSLGSCLLGVGGDLDGQLDTALQGIPGPLVHRLH